MVHKADGDTSNLSVFLSLLQRVRQNKRVRNAFQKFKSPSISLLLFHFAHNPSYIFYSRHLRLDVPFSVYARKENSRAGNAILAATILTLENVVVVFSMRSG